MMNNLALSLPAEYWQSLKVSKQDIDFLLNYLFETETPQTTKELAAVLVEERIRAEREAFLKKRTGKGKIYRPKERYRRGDTLVFPALEWQRGQVVDRRPGVNPEIGEFEVLTVAMEDGQERLFAAQLENHPLNDHLETEPDDEITPQSVLQEHGATIEQILEAALQANEELVRIAGRWFPRALLVDVNMGQLNLAEAVLDMAGGEPLPTTALMKDIELPDGVNPKLTEFSLNYALQEDERFDEVGPAGQVLWCLRRLEPEGVRQIPNHLRYDPIPHDRSLLTEDMLLLEAQLDDELSQPEKRFLRDDLDEVTVSLIYPHWRAGTLPVSERLRHFFPTAYESPRVRFTLVDGKTGKKMPGWVVRKERYVYGLRKWYEENNLIPGSLVRVRHGETPGEVIVEALTRRTTREWMRTVIVGADGGLVFALLKQNLASEIDERMAIVVPDPEALDRLWEEKKHAKRSFKNLVIALMREHAKLTPQGHVHAQELYAAVNLVRRCPPAPLFSLLASETDFVHLGDLYFRLAETNAEDEA